MGRRQRKGESEDLPKQPIQNFWGKSGEPEEPVVLFCLPLFLLYCSFFKQNSMKKIVTVAFFVFSGLMLTAQSYVEQVLVLNEGYYDYFSGEILTPVSVGSYDPTSNLYTELFTIEDARYASDMVIDGDRYFVAADDQLLSYDLNTHELIATATVPGVRKIAVWNDQVLVTRGEYLVSLDNHLQVMDRSTLELLYAISVDDIPYTTEGISIVDNQAFVAVNNGFDFGNEVGQLAIIDLEAQQLESIVELGANGNNPDNLMLDGEYIYTLNNKDYTGSSVSAYRLSDGTLTTTDLINISAGCGTSVLYEGAIYYQELFGTTLSKYNPLTTEVETETEFGQSFYALEFDELNNLMYVTTTDFFSYGNLLVFDAAGNLLHEVSTGVSPGNIAMDVRNAVAIETVTEPNSIQVYPNPAVDYISVSLPLISDYKVYNMSGSQVAVELLNDNAIVVNNLPAGIYTLQVLHDASWKTTTFVRE
jgi:hypothetical protein